MRIGKSLTIGVMATSVISMLIAQGCSESDGVGDPCTPENEYEPTFNGFNKGEVYVES